MRLAVGAAACLVLPSPIVRVALRALGHDVRSGARVGFSLIWCDRICLDRTARIGHLNLIRADRLLLRNDAYIGRMNVIHGPVTIHLKRGASIGNANKIVRAPLGSVTIGRSLLRLGLYSKVTADHRVDATCTVSMGDYSVLAGAGSQIWTHGYVHDLEGPGRYRIDGPVRIGNNVYIGARCVLSMGIRIASGAVVGAGTTVPRSIEEPGLYVSGPMRKLPRPAPADQRQDLERLAGDQLVEAVYSKRNTPSSAP